MKENICTIPVSDVLSEKCGCPICKIHSIIEEKMLNFILGDAMMEPMVRVETNKKGFCTEHYNKMTEKSVRLPMAIMLETHLMEIESELIPKKGSPSKAMIKKADEMLKECFLCEYIDDNFSRTIDTFFKLYNSEKTIRELFGEQDKLCFKHYVMLVKQAEKKVKFIHRGSFSAQCADLARKEIQSLRESLNGFSDAYDYRNDQKMTDESAKSIESTVDFLT